MSTPSETPTFFGPSDSPLFGVLHLPADNRVRGGVLICGSLGKEGMDSIRFQRILAADLAETGYAVLRFDYYGTGDSAFGHHRDDAVALWSRSIRHAADHLSGMGVPSVSAIALRAGGLLVDHAIAAGAPIGRVGYLDPPATGRRYLREQAALYRFTVGPEAFAHSATDTDTVSIIGARLSESAAKSFTALKLTGPVATGADRLFVVRPGDTHRFAATDRTRVIAAPGLAEFAQTADVVVPMPMTALGDIVAWFGTSVDSAPVAVEPRPVTSALMPVSTDSGPVKVLETIETFGPKGLFGIRTRPVGSTPGQGRVVLFFATSNDPHVGPARGWVELGRQIAVGGAQAFRWDGTGLGNSPEIVRDQWQPIYDARRIADGHEAGRHAAQDPRQLSVVGICSGSWYAAHTARELAAGAALLVNAGSWSWPSGAWAWQWNVRRDILATAGDDGPQLGAAPDPAQPWPLRKRIIESLKPLRDQLKTLLRARLPRPLLKLLGRAGLAQVPEVLLGPLLRNDTRTVLMLCPFDIEHFAGFDGFATVARLQRAGLPLRTVELDGGDHAAYHQAVLDGIRDELLGPPCKQSLALGS
ncbi:hypothetical protein ASE48_15030 [Mycobacterium sp. Root265]|uniref:hypothetical protein n=1 Tax=Mycobacterium sp. Root265 TaxID=1736504 RepID=UPI00070BEAD2|nr:hypothetical protein [Mycobacterium sp. Root265]KRD05514.1 hypothetical protein ASE48_15030 [Mycobacterium sp. Root265]